MNDRWFEAKVMVVFTFDVRAAGASKREAGDRILDLIVERYGDIVHSETSHVKPLFSTTELQRVTIENPSPMLPPVPRSRPQVVATAYMREVQTMHPDLDD